VTDPVGGISPEPTDEEAAAISAAMFSLMSGAGGAGEHQDPVSRWRFSGRWWSRPVPSRRVRP
jgi:hypothetical protein